MFTGPMTSLATHRDIEVPRPLVGSGAGPLEHRDQLHSGQVRPEIWLSVN